MSKQVSACCGAIVYYAKDMLRICDECQNDCSLAASSDKDAEKESCETCKYCVSHPAHQCIDYRCHRYAPKMFQNEYNHIITEWPKALGWCGEWKEKKQEND